MQNDTAFNEQSAHIECKFSNHTNDTLEISPVSAEKIESSTFGMVNQMQKNCLEMTLGNRVLELSRRNCNSFDKIQNANHFDTREKPLFFVKKINNIFWKVTQ